ncbi:MAG: efflux RND transporter periplasmic adaptor subunit [Phyllobacteriaceae bacterium]|nr:efflux RND transporter periplasmic adaptor subunit [Phyllobacteriaceae bacterium]
MFSRFARGALLFCLLAGLAVTAFQPSAALAQQERPPSAVTVVTLHKQAVTVTARLPGRVVASGVAEVRPQVNGIIIERLFEEGSRVREGDVLYRIDPATYEAQVAAAEAAVSQARVAFDAAKRDAERISALSSRNVVSEQSVDDAVSKRETAAAAVQVAEAQLLAARINLDRTTIRAQLSGSIGRTLTTQGALVTAGQSEPLSVIRKLDPVYVDVTQSAAELIRWRRNGARQEGSTTVRLTLADRQTYEHTGELTAAEPHVDEQTGVVLLRLEFPNPDELLLPGMYVQVEMPQGVVEDIILAPQGAVSRDRRGNPVAMVVNAANIVEQRELTVLGDRGADWIVSDGLEEGDRLIVEGFQKIGVGAPVQPEEKPAEETQMEETQN